MDQLEIIHMAQLYILDPRTRERPVQQTNVQIHLDLLVFWELKIDSA